MRDMQERLLDEADPQEIGSLRSAVGRGIMGDAASENHLRRDAIRRDDRHPGLLR